MSGFDKLAKPYRWMEYLSFGKALERCRFAFLPQLTHTQNALLLGDGDGRFTAALLREAADAHAMAIDGSSAMLHALQSRCEAGGTGDRLQTVCAPLNNGLPTLGGRFDLIATHFFLDCLNNAEVEHIVRDATHDTTSNARWVISEFRIPDRGAMRPVSRLIVRMLYLSFRILTGLRASQLPDYASILQRHGWHREQQQTRLMGLLTSELWQRAQNENPSEGIESKR